VFFQTPDGQPSIVGKLHRARRAVFGEGFDASVFFRQASFGPSGGAVGARAESGSLHKGPVTESWPPPPSRDLPMSCALA